MVSHGTNNESNGLLDDDDVDDTNWGEILTYGAGGAIVGSLLTYLAFRGKRTT